MRAWLLLLPLLALAACVPAEPQPERLSPTARSACEARGGYVAIAGLSGAEFCAELLPDAGQSCARRRLQRLLRRPDAHLLDPCRPVRLLQLSR